MLAAIKNALAAHFGVGPVGGPKAGTEKEASAGGRLSPLIPTGPNTSAEFVVRVQELMRQPGTHLYLDTSILMWLTKIGHTSRAQLFDWFARECPGRIHVPVWSAHEYLRHHVDETLVAELRKKTKELSRIARDTYGFLRPFMDDALPGHTAEGQRSTMRLTLSQLEELAYTAKEWERTYRSHATEVITFINAHVPQHTGVFDYMAQIEALGAGRYSGRLPPGFQDRGKKEHITEGADDGMQRLIGDNRWGDLVFWKEVLDHAAAARASAILILTNDRKNDWFFGAVDDDGVDELQRELGRDWKPVPVPHPMLSLEARVAAGVKDVELLDARYLGFALRDVGVDTLKAFIDVALVTDAPRASTPKELRKERVRAELDARAERAGEDAATEAQRRPRFRDPAGLILSQPVAKRALVQSRGSTLGEAPAVQLFTVLTDAVRNASSASDVLTEERLRGLSAVGLVSVARALHDQAVAQEPGYMEAVADVTATLRELPTVTASCIYLGFLASMYLLREKNEPRLPPRSPVAEGLFALQAEDFAANAIDAIQKRFEDLDQWPLYLPSAEPPSLDVMLDHLPEAEDGLVLHRLKIAGQQLLTDTQGMPALRLNTMFPNRDEVRGGEVVEHACRLFAIPLAQVVQTADFDRAYRIAPTSGFRLPNTVYVDHERVS